MQNSLGSDLILCSLVQNYSNYCRCCFRLRQTIKSEVYAEESTQPNVNHLHHPQWQEIKPQHQKQPQRLTQGWSSNVNTGSVSHEEWGSLSDCQVVTAKC